MKKFISITIILCCFCFVVSGCSVFKEDIQVWTIASEKEIPQDKEYSDEDITLMNKCSTYIEKYYDSDTLLINTDELKALENDIEHISDKSLFLASFSETEFQNMLNNSTDFYKNGGVYDEMYIKNTYYAQLISIRLRALLYLEEYENFKTLFIDTYNIRWLTTNVQFFLGSDTELQKSVDATETLINTYEELFIMTDDIEEKKIIVTDLMGLAVCDGVDKDHLNTVVDDMKKIADPFDVENQDYTEVFEGFSSPKINPDKEFLCQITITE